MKTIRPMVVSLFFTFNWAQGARSYKPHSGDVLFQTSTSSQSVAIQKATHSPYSHMGIVFVDSKGPVVLEAVEPVKRTPLDQWIARGKGWHYVAKRLRDAKTILTPAAVTKLRLTGDAFMGKHYDSTFEWSDGRIYCSELVWKIYDRALNLKLARLQHLSDFDLTDPVVRSKVLERWHGSPPRDELAISPVQIFRSDLLDIVYEQ